MEVSPKKPQVPILFFLISIANVLGVLYTAALPDLTNFFQVSKAQAQTTVSLYLVGCLLGQFVYAPLANALGRKPALYIGGALLIFGSFLAIFAVEAEKFPLLLVARVLTALGASSGVVLTNTMIADAYSHAEIKKILSYLMSSYALFPTFGITIGGFITQHMSWKGCFYMMLIYSFFVIGLCLLLPETLKEKNLGHLRIKVFARSFLEPLKNFRFLLWAAIASFASIFLYVFSAEAPFIAITSLGISPQSYGLYNLIPNAGLLIGGILAAQLSHRIASSTLLMIGGSIFFLFSFLMWILFEVNIVNIFTLFGLPVLIFFAAPVILSNGIALSLSTSTDKTYASSLIFFMQYLMVFLSISGLSLFPAKESQALPAIYSISGALIVLFCLISRYIPKKKT